MRKAEQDDVEIATAILQESAQWLISKGMPVWDPNEIQPEQVAESVANGELYLAL